MVLWRRGRPRPKRLLLILLASVPLALSAGGCGGGTRSSGSVSALSATTPVTHGVITTSAIPKGQRLRGDGDADNPSDIDGNGDLDNNSPGGYDGDQDSPTPGSYRFPDADDKPTFAYGHPPSLAEEHAIVSVVKRYYAAAAASDGAVACSLLLSSFARSAVESYGQSDGPSYLRGAKSCAALLSMLFRHFHEELKEAISVVQVRVERGDAQTVLSSRKMPAGHIFLALEGRSWKIQQLLGQPLP